MLPEPVRSALENIYISPLELCNLHCKLCYTNKTKHILSNRVILSFLRRYQNYLEGSRSRNFFSTLSLVTDSQEKKNYDESQLSLKSILFCGGEVFTLPNFTRLVNNLQKKGIFISIITNGTIDHLDKIHDPKNCQLLVSFDGPRQIHDTNRGKGNFEKSVKFVKHALALGFPVEIMFLITPDSYPFIDTFNIYGLKNNYITVKTNNFAMYGQGTALSLTKLNYGQSLTRDQIINLKKNYPSIPSKNFGCFQLSLQSNGYIYGCCESPHILGSLNNPINKTVLNFIKSINICSNCCLFTNHKSSTINHFSCSGCCAPDFLCGYKKELSLASCQQVVQTIN